MSEATRKVVVTGSTGFLGRYLLPVLRAEKMEVVGLGRSDSADVVSDYSEKHLIEMFARVDVIVHLAARTMLRSDQPDDISPFLDPNVVLSSKVYQAARQAGVKRIVFASSRAVYGKENQAPFSEQELPRPNTAYGLSKLFAEMSLQLHSRHHGGPEVCSLRIAAIFGFGERESPVLMRFAAQAMRGEQLVLTGHPDYEIDQLYVADVVRAFVSAVHAKGVNGCFNIGCGRRLTLGEIAETVNGVFHAGHPVLYNNVTSEPEVSGHMDISKARKQLKWSPCYSLAEGLAEFRTAILTAQGGANQCLP